MRLRYVKHCEAVEFLYLTFSITRHVLGEIHEIDLKPNGRHIDGISSNFLKLNFTKDKERRKSNDLTSDFWSEQLFIGRSENQSKELYNEMEFL